MYSELQTEQAGYRPMWREIGTYFCPNRYRPSWTDAGRGTRRNQRKIIDPTGSRAVRTGAAGMMSGGTSPSRPWFRMVTPDRELMTFGPVKSWVHDAVQIILSGFLQSNLYQNLPLVYGDAFSFGTAAMLVEENEQTLIHTWSFPCGSYMLGVDRMGRVNTFIYDFNPTVWQLVNMFGVKNERTGRPKWDNFSRQVRDLWDRSQYQKRIRTRFCVYPNSEFEPKYFEAKYKEFKSCYFEVGNQSPHFNDSEKDIFLRESGYDYFPVLAPRWQVNGEDAYGLDSPAEMALGDVKQLQLLHQKKALAVELGVEPPMVGDPTLKTSAPGVVPRHITWADESQGHPKWRSAFDVKLNVRDVVESIVDIRNSIRETMFENLFQAISQMERTQVTAREIEERHDEKLMMLGPVIHQLDQDQNDPLINMAFRFAMKQGLFAPPPPEIEGKDLQVDYISILHQAQKALGLAGVERFTNNMLVLVESFPEVKHKFDAMEYMNAVGDMTGVPPKLLRSKDDAEASQAAEQEQIAAMQKAEQAQAQAKVAKDLSGASLEGDSALSQMLDQAGAGQIMPTGI